ncbi:TPA: glycosyltransferase [Candidatus Bathyarchaeota archaeon]|nr:glycosyltransferase [Candidatus Bathyarchaeota archaeon]
MLEVLKPLKRIAKEYGKRVRFKIASYLGDKRIKALFSPLERFMEVDYGSEKWLTRKEFAKLIYDSEIMVAPLRHTQWYEGKSALRVGIGMGMGIPVIASPVGEQKYVIKHGVNGFLARNEDEWYNYLKILIEDEELRKEIGLRGRKTAEKELSMEVNGRKLYNVINSLMED